MNDRDFMRYSRQILLEDIAIDGQQKLLASRVLIVGLGGLGAPAALYLAGTAEYAAMLEEGFATADSAEACVKLLVTSYVDWVVANPDWARFILHSRGRVEASEVGAELREVNRVNFRRILDALAVYRAQGLFKAMPVDCFTSVVIGPTHDFARHWLAGRTQTSLAECRELLAQVAWDSVRAPQ